MFQYPMSSTTDSQFYRPSAKIVLISFFSSSDMQKFYDLLDVTLLTLFLHLINSFFRALGFQIYYTKPIV